MTQYQSAEVFDFKVHLVAVKEDDFSVYVGQPDSSSSILIGRVLRVVTTVRRGGNKAGVKVSWQGRSTYAWGDVRSKDLQKVLEVLVRMFRGEEAAVQET